jgi:hypothetical protein
MNLLLRKSIAALDEQLKKQQNEKIVANEQGPCCCVETIV